MSDPVVWADLPKSQSDATTIDGEIADAMAVHNADPDAHMESLASLAQHRASEIVDHLAESVVNDKLAVKSRAYVAIVDLESETDFLTIESAIEYAEEKGGGNVLITEGTHYISSVVAIPNNVNLIGLDRDTCIIVTDYDEGAYFTFMDTEDSPYGSNEVSNLTFAPLSNISFGYVEFVYISTYRAYFTSCNFVGRLTYLEAPCPTVFLRDCYFDCGTVAAFFPYEQGNIDACEIRTTLSSGTAVFLGYNYFENRNSMRDCWSSENDARPINYLGSGGFQYGHVEGNTLHRQTTLGFGFFDASIANNKIYMWSTNQFNVSSSGNTVVGNTITGSATHSLVISGDDNAVSGNIVSGTVTNSGSNNSVANNVVV